MKQASYIGCPRKEREVYYFNKVVVKTAPNRCHFKELLEETREGNIVNIPRNSIEAEDTASLRGLGWDCDWLI